MGSSDADVVESSVDAEGDAAGVVDAVASDAAVDVVSPFGGCGFGPSLVSGCRGCLVWERPVGPFMVVERGERVEESLELGDGVRLGLGPEPFLRVCWNRSTFPQVVGWFGREFF